MEKLTLVKIGGNILDNENALDTFLKLFQQLPGKKILVHGGGKIATELSEKIGLDPEMVKGRRVTDAAMLQVVTMVYAGLTNKTLIAKLQGLGVNALGLTGADGNVIVASKRPVLEVDFGFVGDITEENVNTDFLISLINQDIVPVFSAITHDGQGQLFNTNADTIASTLAIALASMYHVRLIYCFEKKGVLKDINNEHSVISLINEANFEELIAQQIIADGMIPKITNSLQATKKGVEQVVIKNANDLLDDSAGTIITK
ncbi:acetylglutamate kinase [Flavobacterium sp. xlx-214]|uniref:acetylglutamate kinase n=1 Tax=unclassified Flavobacterium TaxID=196869 RepID=UPI0013D456D3|nr:MULTISPECIES: acetylglutamate kinase [unclassified Flavobacterium]MBA5792668.1 acetylglutamate kinase [Flavobacterium sp. xlx-221]QMI83815.1 acetylglutamate kinase [Flavobacterium sp. xlx-214]